MFGDLMSASSGVPLGAAGSNLDDVEDVTSFP